MNYASTIIDLNTAAIHRGQEIFVVTKDVFSKRTGESYSPLARIFMWRTTIAQGNKGIGWKKG